MDSDIEEDYESSSDARKKLLEIANSRPSTNVAKAILAYDKTPNLSMLTLLLEEVSKNTDFSTDLSLSLSYYMDEFLRNVCSPSVPRRSIVASAGSVLHYCSKIYGDRVELMFQVVQQQVMALLTAEPEKPEESNNSNGEAKKADVPRVRRTKKLIQKELDPFSFKMEPRKYKTMSNEKRFSRVGFETNKNRNRTIEHLYQDHTPVTLWEQEHLIDPDNPYEQDDKKNYKLFTYHPEPRYNTLLPDIPFERLSLITEYVNNNQMDVSEILNENLTSREYLDEYIALENQMLASRYGEELTPKRRRDGDEDDVHPKRICIEEDKQKEEDLQKQLLENTEEFPNLTEDKDIDMNNKSDTDMDATEREGFTTQISVDSALGDTQKTLETSELLPNDSQMEEPVFSSTLNNENNESRDSLAMRESQLSLPADKDNDCNDLQIDSGIGMDYISSMMITGQSFDDEGVVLADIDEQRLRSLSPKVMVQDILPGVPDKPNLSILVDSEMKALIGSDELPEQVTEMPLEEILNVPREVRYPIELNLFNIPERKLRRDCQFKLTKEFTLFKQARMPSKRVPEPRVPATPRVLAQPSPTHSVSSLDNYPELPLDQREFDSEFNFLGFRRLTYDSGIDQEELRAESANLIIDVGTTLSAIDEEIQEARASQQTEEDLMLPEMPMPGNALDTTVLDQTETLDTLLKVEEDNETAVREADNEFDLTAMEQDIIEPELHAIPADEDPNDEESYIINNGLNTIDEETNARIIDWHRRLAPTLEAAHERQNFSIQDLNDEVIKECEMRNGQATLADVLENKEKTKLCCYMLSSLLLTNQGNVALKIASQDKSKPIELHQVKMTLLSKERKQLNPEDDIGNMRTTKATQPVTSKRERERREEPEDCIEPANAKRVRLIKPVPKASARPEDADSGISSLPASLNSASYID